MAMKADKQRVQQRFKKSLTTYNAHAHVQARMADALLDMVCQNLGETFERVLEIGTGTGLLTTRIRQQLCIQHFFANDLVASSSTFVVKIHPDAHFIPGDAESINNLPDQLDLILSNAVFQWMHDLEGFLKKLHTLLRPQGCLVFTTFGPEHFQEITGLLKISLHYPSLTHLQALCGSRFRLRAEREESIKLNFPDLLSILRHMQALGVNSLQTSPWTRSKVRDLEQRYGQTYGSEHGLPLTYHPIYLVLEAR